MDSLIMIAIAAYFLAALASILDKHIVSNTALKPVPYAFYSGFFQIFYVLLVPLIALAAPQMILVWPPLGVIFWALFDGAVFILGLVALYRATAAGEISRITPIVGVLVPIFTFALSSAFLGEMLTARQLAAFVLFTAGGLLFSLKIEHKNFKYAKGTSYAVLAGFIFAAYYVIMDYVFSRTNFVTAFTFMQAGGCLGALGLLLNGKNRKEIFRKRKNPSKELMKDSHGLREFVANKALSAASALMLNVAIAIGSVTIVNSLQAVQYAFVLIFTIILTKKKPHLLQEETHRGVLLQKGTALALTAAGIMLIS